MSEHKWDDIALGKCDPDMGIKVGDLVTTYHKGYWIVTKIERHFYEKPKPPNTDYRPDWPDGAPLASEIFYRKVAEPDGTPCLRSKRTNSCYSTDCKIWDKDAIQQQQRDEIEDAERKGRNLYDIWSGIKRNKIKP